MISREKEIVIMCPYYKVCKYPSDNCTEENARRICELFEYFEKEKKEEEEEE